MFDTRGDALRLHAPNVAHRHSTRQPGVFAKVFEGAPSQRRAQNVDARPEHDLFAAGQGFLADDLALLLRQGWVPSRGQRDLRGHASGKVVGVTPVSYTHLTLPTI